jgi:hypothetical protein
VVVSASENTYYGVAIEDSTWQDQWQRIMRWRSQVQRGRDEPRTRSDGTEGYRDEVFALYQALWHLKDWLKNDPMTACGEGSAGHTVEKWIKTAHHLLIAADVANGSKHMMQTRAMTRAGGSEQSRNDVTIVVGRGVKHTFYIQDGRAGGAEYEAVDLADLCIAEWRPFLSAHQLDHGLNGFS